jgi:hypothetical protein
MAETGWIVEAGKMLLSAIVGGCVTGVTAFIRFSNKITVLTNEVQSMKNSCLSCKTTIDSNYKGLSEDVKQHHEDADKHTTTSSVRMLLDILNRVTRIEDHLLQKSE